MHKRRLQIFFMALAFALATAVLISACGNQAKPVRVGSKDFTEEVELPFDTLFSLFNRYRLTDRYSSLNATPGSYGLPFYQLNFFDRITDPDKYLLSSFYPLAWQPDRLWQMLQQSPPPHLPATSSH